MLVVVDANAVFSALIRRGKPFEVFKANKIFNAFDVGFAVVTVTIGLHHNNFSNS